MGRDRLALPDAGPRSELISRFADAFEHDDIDGVAVLTEDALVSMPPQPEWHQGRAAIHRFLSGRHLDRLGPGHFMPTGANGGQPAFAYYLQDEHGFARAGLFVVGVRGDRIASITRFADEGLLSRFGVPERI